MDKLTMQEFQTAYPDLHKEIVAAARETGFKEGLAQGEAKGLAAGAANERARINDVRSQLIAGHEKLIEELAADGKTTGPEAAVKVLAAEKAARETNLKKYEEDGKQKVDNASAAEVNQTDGETAKTQTEAGDKLDAFAKDIQKTEKLSYADALAKAKAAHPKLAAVYSGK